MITKAQRVAPLQGDRTWAECEAILAENRRLFGKAPDVRAEAAAPKPAPQPQDHDNEPPPPAAVYDPFTAAAERMGAEHPQGFENPFEAA